MTSRWLGLRGSGWRNWGQVRGGAEEPVRRARAGQARKWGALAGPLLASISGKRGAFPEFEVALAGAAAGERRGARC